LNYDYYFKTLNFKLKESNSAVRKKSSNKTYNNNNNNNHVQIPTNK